MCGEPGIGKTALLGRGKPTAAGMRLLRADGYEAESSMPFAALQRLLIPLRAHLGCAATTPATGAAGGGRSLGRAAAGPLPRRARLSWDCWPPRARTAPVLCVVDDAGLLDVESLDVLAFVARRLEAESVALLFASRDAAHVDEHMAGVPRLQMRVWPRSRGGPVDGVICRSRSTRRRRPGSPRRPAGTRWR